MFASKNELFTRPSGYNISRSVRLRSSASAYFNRTFTTPTSNTKWTFSGWLKRGTLGSGISNTILGSALGGASTYFVLWWSADSLAVLQVTGGSTVANLITTQVFRDPSAWYHIVMVWDSGNATSSNRILLYVNGVQVTSFSTATYPSLNLACSFNQSGTNVIGLRNYASDSYFDGYLTEINFIDGQALTPSSFGSTNAVTGVWQPAKYTGTYGTNGFYLNFSDNSAATAAAIGKDYSGNGNNWTPNNISVTAGVTYDSMIDVPTNFADGGNGRGNNSVCTPINTLAGGATVSGGNLNIVGASASAYGSPATMMLTSGKWYFEVTAGSVASRYPVIGVQTELTAFLSSGFPGGYTANGFGYGSDGNKFVNNGAATAFGSTFTSGDVIGVAIDIDAGKVWLAKNNTWQASGDPVAGTNAAYTPTAGTALYPCVGTYNGAGTHSANFGQRPFSYTPPTGFKALNTFNLPDSTIVKGNKVMDATLYTGTGSSLSVSNAATFQPDFVWVKGRSGATDHALYDSVRGTTKDLASNTTAAETTQATGLTAFNAGGFTVGALAKMNTNTATYVGWQWQAGQGSTSSNTSGSITSTVSVNATAGFSVVTYTGTGANATVGHGLGVAPKMIIVKDRGGVNSWFVQTSTTGASAYLLLNGTAASTTDVTVWNATAPTSTVFSVGTNSAANQSTRPFVAYCWSEVAGYSKFGSYTGNGSTDGPFVFTNFQPRWVMVKRTDSTSDWYIWDTARNTYDVVTNTLLADSSAAETSATSIDALSNGFKCRSATVVNASGGTYIYAAFASSPFKNSLAF